MRPISPRLFTAIPITVVRTVQRIMSGVENFSFMTRPLRTVPIACVDMLDHTPKKQAETVSRRLSII